MKVSARVVAAVTGAVIAIAVQGFQVTSRAAQFETVQKRYELDGGASVEVVGVCHLTEDSVECWDYDGAHDERLTEMVENSLMNGRHRVSLGYRSRNLEFRYGKKNRYIVVRHVYGSQDNQLGIVTDRMNALNGESTDMDMGFLVEHEITKVMIYYNVFGQYFDREATETHIRLMASTKLDEEIGIVFKEGEQFSLNGVDFVLEEPKRPQVQANEQLPFVWTASVKSIVETQGYYYVRGYAVDKNGDRIRYIDQKGRPISAREYEALIAELKAISDDIRGSIASSAVVGFLGDGFRARPAGESRNRSLRTGVDPKYIKEVRFTGTWSRRIRIVGIPLDPAD